jgi:hypothetical protein
MSEGLSEADTCRKFVVPRLLAAPDATGHLWLGADAP